MHNWLGHLPFQKLKIMEDCLNLSCNGKKNSYSIPCFISPLAKQMKLSFVSNNHLSQNALDLIHYDTWGLYHVPTHASHRFFLTLVDDYTHFMWTYLMKHKSDVSHIIPQVFQHDWNSISHYNQEISIWQCPKIAVYRILCLKKGHTLVLMSRKSWTKPSSWKETPAST